MTEKLTLEEIGQFIEKACSICRYCRTPLTARNVGSYPHPEGVSVKGLPWKQWIYFLCPNSKCGYAWALWKLHVCAKKRPNTLKPSASIGERDFLSLKFNPRQPR